MAGGRRREGGGFCFGRGLGFFLEEGVWWGFWWGFRGFFV